MIITHANQQQMSLRAGYAIITCPAMIKNNDNNKNDDNDNLIEDSGPNNNLLMLQNADVACSEFPKMNDNDNNNKPLCAMFSVSTDASDPKGLISDNNNYEQGHIVANFHGNKIDHDANGHMGESHQAHNHSQHQYNDPYRFEPSALPRDLSLFMSNTNKNNNDQQTNLSLFHDDNQTKATNSPRNRIGEQPVRLAVLDSTFQNDNHNAINSNDIDINSNTNNRSVFDDPITMASIEGDERKRIIQDTNQLLYNNNNRSLLIHTQFNESNLVQLGINNNIYQHQVDNETGVSSLSSSISTGFDDNPSTPLINHHSHYSHTRQSQPFQLTSSFSDDHQMQHHQIAPGAASFGSRISMTIINNGTSTASNFTQISSANRQQAASLIVENPLFNDTGSPFANNSPYQQQFHHPHHFGNSSIFSEQQQHEISQPTTNNINYRQQHNNQHQGLASSGGFHLNHTSSKRRHKLPIFGQQSATNNSMNKQQPKIRPMASSNGHLTQAADISESSYSSSLITSSSNITTTQHTTNSGTLCNSPDTTTTNNSIKSNGAAQVELDMHGGQVVNLDGSERFSRKVFVGGLPPDIDEDEIRASFKRFGNLVVDWPHKSESKSYFPPKGYAFLLFHEESSVQKLIDACIQENDKLYLSVSSPTIKDKPVQIRSWRLSDADYVLDSSLALDPRKTVFVGGVPRPLKASELAIIMNNLYGGVCYAGIDTDPELKYPKGAGRVAFSNHHSYIAAISARFVHLKHHDLDKRVEVKPYVLDDQYCDECKRNNNNNNNNNSHTPSGEIMTNINHSISPSSLTTGSRKIGSGANKTDQKFAPFFCASITCLRYYCENCWSIVHNSHSGREFHKPLVKEGSDRPRTIPGIRWNHMISNS